MYGGEDPVPVEFTEENPLVIQSYSENYEDRAVVYSTSTSITSQFIIKVSHVKFNMLKFIGGPSVNYVMAIGKPGLSDFSVHSSLFSFETAYNGTNCQISGNAISLKYEDWIVDGVSVVNNIFIGKNNKSSHGLYVGSGHLTLMNNTFYRMALAARMDDADMSEAKISNNVLVSGQFGLIQLMDCTGILNIFNCLAWDFSDSYRFVLSYTPITVNYVDTLWRDPGLSDMDPLSKTVGTLLPTSACIDAGACRAGMLTYDYFGTLHNSTPDMGAVEYSGCYASPEDVSIYVREEGDGVGGLGLEENPFHSINGAFNSIPGGLVTKSYRLILLPRSDGLPYSLGFLANLHCNFTRTHPLTIMSEDIEAKVEMAKSGTIFNLRLLKNVVIDGIVFKNTNSSPTATAILGASHPTIGKTDNVTVRRCKFINTVGSRLQGLFGLGDSLVVENCIFYSNEAYLSFCINRDSYGGKYWTVVNNTVLGNWRYFLYLSDLTGSVFANNVVVGIAGQTDASYGWALTGSNKSLMAVNVANYIYLREDANETILPSLNTDMTSPLLGTPSALDNSPLIIDEIGASEHSYYVGSETPKDDFFGRYDVLGKRDLGAVEVGGFAFTDAAYYVRNQSGNVVVEYDKDQEKKYENIYGNGLIGKVVYSSSGTPMRFYYIKNHLGSTMKVVNEDGEDVSRIQYYSYGLKSENLSGMPGDLGEAYTGKSLDENGGRDVNNDGDFTDAGDRMPLGYYYFGARYYDPELGVWLSQDPAHQFANPYAYAGNMTNPIIFVDDQGLELRIYTRPAFGGLGEHAFVYSTETGKHAGTTGSSSTGGAHQVSEEDLEGPYVVVELPEGMTEEEAIEKLQQYPGWNSPVYVPGWNDCHSQLKEAFDYAGIEFPGMPTGRTTLQYGVAGSFIHPPLWVQGFDGVYIDPVYGFGWMDRRDQTLRIKLLFTAIYNAPIGISAVVPLTGTIRYSEPYGVSSVLPLSGAGVHSETTLGIIGNSSIPTTGASSSTPNTGVSSKTKNSGIFGFLFGW